MTVEASCPSCGTKFEVEDAQVDTSDELESMPAAVSIASGCLVVILLGTLPSLISLGPDPWSTKQLWTLIPLSMETVLILGLSHRKSLARWTSIILSGGMAILFLMMAGMILMPAEQPNAEEGWIFMLSMMTQIALIPAGLFVAIISSLLMPSARQWCNQ